MAIQLSLGQSVRLSEEQMQQLQLPSFTLYRGGFGTSHLPQYAGYNFTWWVVPVFKDDDISGKTSSVYHYYLTVYALPTLNTPIELAGEAFTTLSIRADGQSDRADLKGYCFETTYLGQTEKCEKSYRVIMKKNSK